MAITHYYSFPYQIIIDFHGIRHFCQKEIRIRREQFNGTWKLFKFRFQRRAGIVRAALLFVGFYGILLAERRCPTKRRRLLLLTGLAVLLFGAKQAREGNFLEFRSRRSQRREGCLMTTSEILLLFQTIIALLALLVSVVHLMDDRKKDDSYGSKRKKHKKK